MARWISDRTAKLIRRSYGRSESCGIACRSHEPYDARRDRIRTVFDRACAAQGLASDIALQVLAVFVSEHTTTVADYAGRVGLTYPQVADPDTRIASAYRILGIPSHYFIDRTGVLRQVKIGTLDPAGMDAALGDIQR